MVAQKASYRYMNNQLDKAYRIYTVIAAIPYGNVISYGDVARLAGLPRGARLVGWVLKKLPEETQLPWHRVEEPIQFCTLFFYCLYTTSRHTSIKLKSSNVFIKL